MIQTIIVLIIIVFSIVYSVYAVLKNIRKKDTSPCDDCNGCDIKNEIMKNLKSSTKDPSNCGCSGTPARFAKGSKLSKDPTTCGCSPK